SLAIRRRSCCHTYDGDTCYSNLVIGPHPHHKSNPSCSYHHGTASCHTGYTDYSGYNGPCYNGPCYNASRAWLAQLRIESRELPPAPPTNTL
ncbi:unnamed protein product, partial [Closterium sp. NIES-53]